MYKIDHLWQSVTNPLRFSMCKGVLRQMPARAKFDGLDWSISSSVDDSSVTPAYA